MNDQKNMFCNKVIWRPLQFASVGRVHHSPQNSVSNFFLRHPVYLIWPHLYRVLCLLGGRLPTWPTSPLPPSASAALGNKQGGAASMLVRIQIPPPLTSSTSLEETAATSCQPQCCVGQKTNPCFCPFHWEKNFPSCILAVMAETETFSGYHFYILALFDLILISVQLAHCSLCVGNWRLWLAGQLSLD